MVPDLTAQKTAVITGITGQDGAYLCRELLTDGYKVHGVGRDLSRERTWRLHELGLANNTNLQLIEMDITVPSQVLELVAALQPEEVFNLASHSYVLDSFNDPYNSAMVTGIGTLNLLLAIARSCPTSRFFQAGSSEMFGEAEVSPQDEGSHFHPRNIYASSKLFSHSIVTNFREAQGLFASTAILYNHESPLRGEQFVTRKITSAVARISLGMQSKLEIGNLDSIRDWGYAPEYVSAMRRVINFDFPDTFVLATGKGTSVREFVRLAFQAIDIEVEFDGQGLSEKGHNKGTGQEIVSVNSEFFRLAESVSLVGNPKKAEDLLGWKATKSLSEIIREMVVADISRLVLGN